MVKVYSNGIVITDDKLQKGLQTMRSVRSDPPKTKMLEIITGQCISVWHQNIPTLGVHNLHDMNADSAAPHEMHFTIAHCTLEETRVVTYICAPQIKASTEKGLLSQLGGNIDDVVMAELLRVNSHHVTAIISGADICSSMP